MSREPRKVLSIHNHLIMNVNINWTADSVCVCVCVCVFDFVIHTSKLVDNGGYIEKCMCTYSFTSLF